MDRKFQYQPTSVEYVMDNPEEYIIPECIECCKILWKKGIDTFQCGNYEDSPEVGFWVEIDSKTLSKKNEKILDELSKSDTRVFFNEGLQMQHNFVIRVKRTSKNPSKELCSIAEKLSLQDTSMYITIDDLLDKYMRIGGEMYIDPKGYVGCKINPLKVDATIEDALSLVEENEIYVEEEGRIYMNQHAYNVHINFLKSCIRRS